MRPILGLSLLLATVASISLAQVSAAVSAAESACGPGNVRFDMKSDKSQHTAAQPEAGKALVYVIQDVGTVHCIGACFIAKIALDGAWKGANQRNSFFSFAVDAGERHLYAKSQSDSSVGAESAALAHFTAEVWEGLLLPNKGIGTQSRILVRS